jgi:hypothetical protein
MTRAHLLTAAAVLIACGCSDSSVEPNNSVGVAPPELPAPVVIRGTVEVSSVGVSLRVLESGELIDLVGSEAQRIAPLYGAELQLSGTWTGPIYSPLESDVDPVKPAFAVGEFLVLVVEGRAAMDGVLEQDEGRYYLRLATGDVFWFEEGPSEFDANIGKRIWVTGSVDDPPLTFGVIN